MYMYTYIERISHFNSQELVRTRKERWGAGVETHFQEISWNLRPVVNGT